MVIPQYLLAILVCPLSRVKLQLADSSLLAALNVRIAEGTLKNRAGARVDQPLSAALVTEDRRYAYPVRDEIPVLLADEALELQ